MEKFMLGSICCFSKLYAFCVLVVLVSSRLHVVVHGHSSYGSPRNIVPSLVECPVKKLAIITVRFFYVIVTVPSESDHFPQSLLTGWTPTDC